MFNTAAFVRMSCFVAKQNQPLVDIVASKYICTKAFKLICGFIVAKL